MLVPLSVGSVVKRQTATPLHRARGPYAENTSANRELKDPVSSCTRGVAIRVEGSKVNGCAYHAFIQTAWMTERCVLPGWVSPAAELCFAQNSYEAFCNICWCEALSASPAVALQSCGHVFHLECLQKRLKVAAWALLDAS